MLSIVSALAVAATTLAAAMIVPLALPQPAVPRITTAIEFRLAETEPGPGLTPVEKQGRTFYLRPEILISTSDIASARQDIEPLWGSPVVSLVLTDAGRERLASVTADHVGEILAITVNGVMLTAPVIREPIMGGALQISGLDSLADARDLAGKLGHSPVPSSRSLADSLRVRFKSL